MDLGSERTLADPGNPDSRDCSRDSVVLGIAPRLLLPARPEFRLNSIGQMPQGPPMPRTAASSTHVAQPPTLACAGYGRFSWPPIRIRTTRRFPGRCSRPRANMARPSRAQVISYKPSAPLPFLTRNCGQNSARCSSAAISLLPLSFLTRNCGQNHLRRLSFLARRSSLSSCRHASKRAAKEAQRREGR